MKRDMDLVRKILLAVEESDGFWNGPFEIDGFDPQLVNDHILLVQQAGLLSASWSTKASGAKEVIVVQEITWEGHEFLDAARNEGIWREVKETLKEKGVDGTFELVKKIASKLLEKKFNSLFEDGETLELE